MRRSLSVLVIATVVSVIMAPRLAPVAAQGERVTVTSRVPFGRVAEGRNSYEAIQERLSRLHPGVPITITVLRDGRRLELTGRLP